MSILTGSADAYTSYQSRTLDVAAPGVLGNDHAPTGSNAQATLTQAPSHGDLTLSTSGSIQYIPADGFSGIDQFTYRVSANGLQSWPITVAITVIGDITPLSSATCLLDLRPHSLGLNGTSVRVASYHSGLGPRVPAAGPP